MAAAFLAGDAVGLSDTDSPSFEVRVIGGAKGKGLFALKPFKEGDVIFEEKPLVCCQFLWNAAFGYRACDYCMRSLETAEENVRRLTGQTELTLPHLDCCTTCKEEHVRCPHCEMTYCSIECRHLAWEQYHQVLCLRSTVSNPNHPLEQLQEAWRHMHYPPETANIMLIARMIATVKQAKDKLGAIHLFSQFCHNTVNEEEEIAHKLLGDKFRGQLETLRKLMLNALYDEHVDQWFTPEGFRSLIALVGLNGQGIGTSPLSVWVKNCDSLELSNDERQALDLFIDQVYTDIEKEAGGFLNNEGSALYPLQSSCNHSCISNAEPSFPDNNFNLVMMAVKDIDINEIRPREWQSDSLAVAQYFQLKIREICVSYLDECSRNRSRHTRIKLLRENYLFTCTCDKCNEQINDPDITSEEDEDEDDDVKENDMET